MYLLDWKVPRRLEEPRDQIYNHYINTTGEQHTTTQKDKMVKAIGCFVYNASYNLAGGKKEFDVTLHRNHYSQPLVYNCNRVKRKVSYHYTKLLVDWLCAENLITLSLGSVSSFKQDSGRLVPAECEMSLVGLSEELVGLLEHVSSKQDQDIQLSVLEFKDDEGNLRSKRLGENQKKLITLVDNYNRYLNGGSITLDGEEYLLRGKKVFNGAWNRGGRTYLCGLNVMSKLMKRSNRSRVKINGESSAEVDWKACHLSIIAEMEGFKFTDGFDPYQIQIEGYDDPCLRSIAKIGMLCLVNATSTRQAMQALNFEMLNHLPVNEWKRKGLIPTTVRTSEVMSNLIDRNNYARGWLGEGRGLELQHKESLMMDYVIDELTQKETLILPIHDGILIEQSKNEVGVKSMTDSYINVMGSRHNCNVEVK